MNEENNWECKKCGHVCARKLGIVTHLRRHHDITKIKGMVVKTSEKVTRPNQTYVNRTNKQKINYKCRECGHICGTVSGIRTHLMNLHKLSTAESFEKTSGTVTNPFRRKRKMKTKKKNKNICPGGGKFGIDTDELKECDNCSLWDKCDSSFSSINSEANKMKRHSKPNEKKPSEFPIEIRIDSDGMRIITPIQIEVTHVVIPKKGIANAN